MNTFNDMKSKQRFDPSTKYYNDYFFERIFYLFLHLYMHLVHAFLYF